MPYLFQVSLGPVQSFIAGARRTRDLKFGSWFLSNLAREAARVIAENEGEGNLIFPALTLEELKDTMSPRNVSNKLLARIQQAPDKLGEAVGEAIKAEVERLKKEVFDELKGTFNRETAERQVLDLVEYSWVALPYNDTPETYVETRQKLEALLAARKNTRNFAQVHLSAEGGWGSGEYKSSIDGQLESAIPFTAYPRRNASGPISQLDKNKIQQLRTNFGAGPHERLSGVDLLKRHGKMGSEATTFPSTSHIAALPFLIGRRAADQRARDLWSQYCAQLARIKQPLPLVLDSLPETYQGSKYWGTQYFSPGIYDGSILFPERFPDMMGDTQAYREARADFQKATALLSDFFDHVAAKPDPYYALFVADGDSMGQAIDALARDGWGAHREFSQRLEHFAGQVREIVKRYAGVCIYAGGDDALALLPLHTAVQCAVELAETFHGQFKHLAGHAPTLSAGLAVVHHLHPLGDALNIARAAEERAKRGTKNALAITVQKRGGPPCEVGGRWQDFTGRLKRLIRLYTDEIIPAGMAYELADLAVRLDEEENGQKRAPVSPDFVQFAALRVFKRKLDEVRRGGIKQEVVDKAMEDLREMIDLSAEKERDSKKQIVAESGPNGESAPRSSFVPVRVGQLADELVVARLFAATLILADWWDAEATPEEEQA